MRRARIAEVLARPVRIDDPVVEVHGLTVHHWLLPVYHREALVVTLQEIRHVEWKFHICC